MSHRPRIALLLEIHVLYKRHSELFAGVQRYAMEHGWETFIDDYVDLELSRTRTGESPYDGVIARVNEQSLALVDETRRHGIPLVNVMRGSSAADRLPGVFPDFEEIGRLRAEHLLSRGLRRFAYFEVQGVVPAKLQAEGFVSTIEQAGYEVSRFTVPDTGLSIKNYPVVIADVDRWMDTWQAPLGLAMDTDIFARLLIQKCRQRGLNVPGDVAIIGGMNEEKLCEQPHPSITSVEVGYDRVGYEAAKMLGAMMKEASHARERKHSKKATPTPKRAARSMQVLLPPTGVVVRESTDFYAVSDRLVADAMAYIAEQCHLHLQVSDVAAAVGVSTTTLQNRFTEALGRKVAQEIRRVRIEKVKRELTGSERKIEDIALRCGFGSRIRLYEVFKREVGLTPSAYRKQRRSEHRVEGVS